MRASYPFFLTPSAAESGRAGFSLPIGRGFPFDWIFGLTRVTIDVNWRWWYIRQGESCNAKLETIQTLRSQAFVIEMILPFRLTTTATGKTSVVIGSECAAHEFAERAQAFADHLGLVIDQKTAGLDELIWLAHRGSDKFCISWDIWFPEVAIMAWEGTPDTAVQKLIEGIEANHTGYQ
jgi:hypothetical protein